MNKRCYFLRLLSISIISILAACANLPDAPHGDGKEPTAVTLTPLSTAPAPSTIVPSAPAIIPDWIRTARISTAASEDWDEWMAEVDTAVANGANVILGWDRFQGVDWRTLFEPQLSEALAMTQERAQWIHQTYPGVRYIIYMAPLEATIDDLDSDGDGRVDPGKEELSLALQHPEWAQVGVDGRSAIFFGTEPGMPFWVCPACEDVWLTPANPEFRAATVNQIQRIAAETELDGIWHDVPFLMGGYFGDGWTGQFPDVGPDARALFTAETGYALPTPPFEPDWNDPAWQHFVTWRYGLINGYLGAIREAIEAVNPDFTFIPESSVHFDAALTQVAASPIDIPAFSDTTAHELGGTERPSQYYRWLWFLSVLQTWRHMDIAYGEPSWLLGYVESGHDDTLDVARLHAAATELSGFRTLTSGDEGMTAVTDLAFRHDLYHWLDGVGAPLGDEGIRPYANIALVYSRQSLDFVGHGDWNEGYSASFYGAMMILLESHIPFAVIADTDLGRLSEFEAAILPSMISMSDGQVVQIRDYVNDGGKILATGYTSQLDEFGNARDELALADLFGATRAEIENDEDIIRQQTYGAGTAVLSPEPHEQWYFWEASPEDDAPSSESGAEEQRTVFLDLLARLSVTPILTTDAPRSVILLPYLNQAGSFEIGVVNLTGVDAETAVPIPQSFIITLPAYTEPVEVDTLSWVELLGEVEEVTAVYQNGQLTIPILVEVGGLLK